MSLITNPGHGITLGGLALITAGKPVTHSGGFTLDVSRDGTTWGNPAVVVSALISELSDGDLVTQEHVGNREPVLYVRISASTHAGLVAGDTALSAVVGPPCELSWQNPDPAAPLTVIDVVHARMDHAWDDWDALNHRRVWVVTMSALPWPRGAVKIITPAVATASSTVVNSGSATTGWTTGNGTVSVVSGAVVSTYNPAVDLGGYTGSDLMLTAAIDTTTQKYIAVDWKTSLQAFHSLWFNNNPNFQSAEVRREPLAAGYTRSWYKVPEATTGLTSIKFVIVQPLGSGSATLSIDQVTKSATLPSTGTTRQLTRTLDPGGNVPAEGDVLVQHETSGLGQTIVFSHPAGGGYSPPLRPWLTASDTVTVASAEVSGASHSISSLVTWYQVPVSALPEGDVHLWARLGITAGGAGIVPISWSAEGVMGSTAVGTAQAGSTNVTFPASGWVMVPLARLTLPPGDMGSSGFVRIALLRGSAAQTIVVDEAWLFAMDRGRLTVVDCGTGTPTTGTINNRLKVQAPSLDTPRGGILTATSPAWSDGFTPPAAKVLCDQVGHRFDPSSGTFVFTASSGATAAAVSLEHYQRFRAEAG